MPAEGGGAGRPAAEHAQRQCGAGFGEAVVTLLDREEQQVVQGEVGGRSRGRCTRGGGISVRQSHVSDLLPETGQGMRHTFGRRLPAGAPVPQSRWTRCVDSTTAPAGSSTPPSSAGLSVRTTVPGSTKGRWGRTCWNGNGLVTASDGAT